MAGKARAAAAEGDEDVPVEDGDDAAQSPHEHVHFDARREVQLREKRDFFEREARPGEAHLLGLTVGALGNVRVEVRDEEGLPLREGARSHAVRVDGRR